MKKINLTDEKVKAVLQQVLKAAADTGGLKLPEGLDQSGIFSAASPAPKVDLMACENDSS